MAYAIGHISGCYLNPAVSVSLAAGGRFKSADLIPYIIAQVLGAIVAAAVLYFIASGKAGFDPSGGLASNGYGDHSPGGYSLGAGFVTEVVMTFMFLFVILGATDAQGRGLSLNRRRQDSTGRGTLVRSSRSRPRADEDQAVPRDCVGRVMSVAQGVEPRYRAAPQACTMRGRLRSVCSSRTTA